MKVNQKLSILFFLNRKKTSNDGLAPIYVRLTIDSQKRETSLALKLPPDDWDNRNKKAVGGNPNAKQINSRLNQVRVALERHMIVLDAQHDIVSPSMLMAAFSPTKKKAPVAKTVKEEQTSIPDFMKQVDALTKDCFVYFSNEKKIANLKHPMARSYQLNKLVKPKEKLLKDIERLVFVCHQLYADPTKDRTLDDACYEFLLYFLRKVMGDHRTITTFRRWCMTKEKIKAFTWYHYKKTVLPLDKIGHPFANNMYEYLTLVDGCGHNGSMKYIKNLKQVLDRTVMNGWILQNPIKSFKCTYIEPDIEPIGMEDIQSMIKADLSQILNEVRDVFLFSCFTGYAYEEAKNLTPGHMFTGVDGKKWIGIDRTKTDGSEKIPLLPIALQLIEKYKNHPCRIIDGRLIPVHSNQYYNRLLKTVAKECGIRKELTTHIARHTFATTVTLENDVPMPTVGKMLGHRSIRTTERYAKVTQKKVSRNMGKVEDLLFDKDGNLVNMQ